MTPCYFQNSVLCQRQSRKISNWVHHSLLFIRKPHTLQCHFEGEILQKQSWKTELYYKLKKQKACCHSF